MITVSGNLFEISSSPSVSSFVRFWLRGTGGNQPFVSGVALLAPDGGNTWYSDLYPDSLGAVSGSLYSTSQVTVGGQTGAIYYGMQVFHNGYAGPESPIDASANININNPNILTTLPVVPAPTGDGTYLRLDGTNSPVTGPITVLALNDVAYADVYGSIDAAVASFAGQPCVVIIPANYAGPESVNLFTTSTGYKVYTAANNVTIIDQRANAATPLTPGNAPLYPLVYGGRCEGQLIRLGVNYYAASPADSTAAIAGLCWPTGTLPTNSGTQTAIVGVLRYHDALTVGSSSAVGIAIAGEAYADQSSVDTTIPGVRGIYGAAGIDRVNAVGVITEATSLYAGVIRNDSTAGATITNAYGIHTRNQSVGTTDNYGIFNEGNWLQNNETELRVKDSGGTKQVVMYWRNTNVIDLKPLSDAGGWVWKTLAGSPLVTLNTTDIQISRDLKPSTAAGRNLGSTPLPFAGLVLGNAAGQSVQLNGTFTGNQVQTLQDATGSIPVIIASGTTTLTSATVTTNTCQTAVTTAATGALTTDTVSWSYATAPGTADALMHVSAYLTANNINFTRCNATSASQSGTAIVINWRVIR